MAPTRRQRMRRILIDVAPIRLDRDFRWLWLGQLVSGFGRAVTTVALPWQLFTLTYATTHRADLGSLAIGLLALVQMVAILFFALGGGALADSLDRRTLLLVTQLSLAGTSAALVVLAANPGAPIWAYYVVAFAAAGIGAVDQPARSSAIPRLVPRERLTAAISLGQLGYQTVGVVGPALGGAIIATLGVSAAFAFDVATFAAAIVAVVVIAPIPPLDSAQRPTLGAIAEGIRFAWNRRVVAASFVVDLDAMVFGMPAALFPALALTVFHVGSQGYGLLNAAPAAGALVGAVLTGWTAHVRRSGLAVVVAVAAWGAAIAAFGLLTMSFPLALLCLAFAGAADVISAVFRSAIVQFETPDRLRGRVMALHTLVVTSGPRLGDAEAAAMAAIAGPQFSVVSGGVLCLLGLAAVVRAFPELPRYESRALHATTPVEAASVESTRAPAPPAAAPPRVARLPFAEDPGETEIDEPARPADRAAPRPEAEV